MEGSTNEKQEQCPRVKAWFKKAGNAIVRFAAVNYLMLAYIVISLLIELTGIAVTAGKFFMAEPWLYFTFIAVICVISQYLPGHKSRYALFFTAMLVNFIIDLIFIVIFDSTGGTVFDYAMLNLRRDAMAIVETLPFDFTFIFVSSLLLVLYGTLGFMLIPRMPKPDVMRASKVTTSTLVALVVCINVMISYIGNSKSNSNDLSYMLYQNETATYSNKGFIGNLYNELVRGTFFSEIEIGDENELKNFIYQKNTEHTDMFGKASGYNVVTILGESFEWFTFLYDEQRYPNGYAKTRGGDERGADEIIANLKTLFPNLYRFYENKSTVVLNNSYSLEKTDISENKSIIGNYPLYEYINYAYPENTVPYSLPNILKNMYGVESNSFHDGYKEFYNRDKHHTNALGFNSYTATEDMGIEDDSTGLGERNLDSLMFETCKEKMFPTGRRFNTYITTITQHGQYAYRENLKPYYEKLDELNILPFDENDDDGNALRYYCAAGMDLDKALGIMFDYLENTDYLDEKGMPVYDEKGNKIKLADRTLITIFGDHNCYYQGISNYVKNIYSSKLPDYTELYRVPVMMKVGSLSLDNRFINKFTCVADIYPTILDLLGITAFSNLTYGVSAFSEQESILYSRAYGKFITDKIYFNSLNNIIYRADDVDQNYLDDIEARATTLLDKISHVNRIFASDFFKGEREAEFYEKLRSATSTGA